MNKKKIIFIIPTLRTAGGSERVISELANYTAENSLHETHLIILAKGEIFFEISQKVIIHQPAFNHKKYSRLVFSILLMADLRKKVKVIKPDVLLSFEEMYSSFVLMATLFLGYNVFVSDRSKPDKNWGFFFNKLRKILYPFAKGIISQTTYSKKFLSKEIGHKNIAIIPNPVKPFPANHTSKQNVILSVGRLITTKKIDLLLKIFSNINNSNWQLWIVGDGPQKENLETLTKELGIFQKVVFWGNQKDVNQFYSKAKIFAFTSISEGFPNAILEAMAAGLPTISFDCIAGPSDLIIDNINGFLIPELDLSAYQEKLELLINNKEVRSIFSENALTESKKYFIDKIGDAYLKFLFNEKKNT
ncbi:MAG: glycosyltransferase family 4 protein [Weeksellaceae bacterium]|nr:glycosyltransferase family 4 protein [Weeksellaceae bacterium]